MAEMYLKGIELSESDKLSLRDFFDKVDSSSDIKLIDTVTYKASTDNSKHFNTWITINGVPCVCGITTFDSGECNFYLTYINHKTRQEINMRFCGNGGYAASIFLLRARLWASKNKGIFKAQKPPKSKNDTWCADLEKTII